MNDKENKVIERKAIVLIAYSKVSTYLQKRSRYFVDNLKILKVRQIAFSCMFPKIALYIVTLI